MKPLLIADLRKMLKGTLLQGEEDWYIEDAIVYKPRRIVKARTLIFVAMYDKVDWRRLEKFSPCVVVTDKSKEELQNVKGQTIIRVSNRVQAFWKFVDYYRSMFDIPVVTITGTCGKTTTKEIIKHLLSKDYNVQASIGSINQPSQSLSYLVGMDEATEVGVFEHGLGNPGNITHQCMVYRPTIGIITNIGAHHLDRCKTVEGYIQAKAEIVSGLQKDGTLILNADDENSQKIPLDTFTGKVVYVGLQSSADFWASHIQYGKDGMEFTLHLEHMVYPMFVPGYGEHQVYNALAALAAVHQLGMGMREAGERLASFVHLERHMEMSAGINASTIIDDTWTNNPTSVKASLKVLDAVGQGKKIIILLGDINRLGDFEQEFHRELGSMIAKRNVHTLITVGLKAEEIARQAIREKFTGNVHIFHDVTHEIDDILRQELDQHSLLLIKGPMKSHAMIELAQRVKQSQ